MGAGSGNSATRRAEQEEKARQARMAAGEQQVNRAFDSPARLAGQAAFLKAIRENYMGDANRQKDIADRRLKFALARGGQTGGSIAVSGNQRLGEEFNKGILTSENRAQGALSDLRAEDENARQSLISMIRAGADTGQGGMRIAQMTASNAAGAKARALTEGVGDIFAGTADTYLRQEDAAARRRGARDAQTSLYAKPFTG